MKMTQEEKEKLKSLQLMKEVETSDVAIKIYDLCKDKKEYKNIYKLCNRYVREFIRLSTRTRNKICIQEETVVGENLFLCTTIRNYDPRYINKDVTHPMEIGFKIQDENKNGITVSGSSYFGGCTESEADEFIKILKEGNSDLDFIKEEDR